MNEMPWDGVIQFYQAPRCKPDSLAAMGARGYAHMAQEMGLNGPVKTSFSHADGSARLTFERGGRHGWMEFDNAGKLNSCFGSVRARSNPEAAAEPADPPAPPRKLKVFVSSPYTLPDPVENTRRAIAAGNSLMYAGYAPYVPHLNLLWHFHSPKSYEQWLTLDREWLTVCDAVFRLPGESPGADREVALAKELGIPVVEHHAALIGLEPLVPLVGRVRTMNGD